MKSNMNNVVVVKAEEKLQSMAMSYGALELEAAAALLMLRYQYDIKVGCTVAQMTTTTPPSPPPPSSSSALLQPAAGGAAPAAAEVVVKVDKCTPKEQVRSGNAVNPMAQPLKKRIIPPHLLRRSPTSAKSTPVANRSSSSSSGSRSGSGSGKVSGSGTGIIKAKLIAMPAAPCNKALLKSCRNMIREFLDNQELF